MGAKDIKVVGIDYIDALVRLSEQNIKKNDADLLKTKQVEIYEGDGWKGNERNAPFNIIHVGAAAAAIPQALVFLIRVHLFLIWIS